MWDWFFIILGIIALLVISRAPVEAFRGHESPARYQGSPLANPSAYYQQHSRYPNSAWWIPYNEPQQKCHLKARVQCHNQYCYDNCYEHVLNNCQAPKGQDSYMRSYQVQSSNPPQCPQSPPFPNYLGTV